MEISIKSKGDSTNLINIHSILSGLKPLISTRVLEDLEECRQSCGGQGFLGSAGLSHILQNHYWYVTVEGENKMIIQQTARYILKSMRKLVEGGEVSSDFMYMKNVNKAPNLTPGCDINLLQIKELIEARAYFTNTKVSIKFNKLLQQRSIMEIWNELLQPELVKMAFLHTETYFFNTVYQEMTHCIDTKELEATVGNQMLRMLKITGIRMLLRDLTPLYSNGIFKSNQQQLLFKEIKKQIQQLRPYALSLVESFGFEDQFLYSTIGMKYTDPYDAILKNARENNPLNREKTLPGFQEYMRPLMKAKL